MTMAMAMVNSAMTDCTKLFKQSFKVLITLKEDLNIKRLETEVLEL